MPIVVDAFRELTLPRSWHLTPGDRVRLERFGKGRWILRLLHEERLAAPKFKRVIEALDNPARHDVYQRQFVRHWLETYRPDRGSLTGRIVFRHALRAKRKQLLAKPALNDPRKAGSMMKLWV